MAGPAEVGGNLEQGSGGGDARRRTASLADVPPGDQRDLAVGLAGKDSDQVGQVLPPGLEALLRTLDTIEGVEPRADEIGEGLVGVAPRARVGADSESARVSWVVASAS